MDVCWLEYEFDVVKLFDFLVMIDMWDLFMMVFYKVKL